DDVVSVTTEEVVVAAPAENRVGTGTTVELVVACRALVEGRRLDGSSGTAAEHLLHSDRCGVAGSGERCGHRRHNCCRSRGLHRANLHTGRLLAFRTDPPSVRIHRDAKGLTYPSAGWLESFRPLYKAVTGRRSSSSRRRSRARMRPIRESAVAAPNPR